MTLCAEEYYTIISSRNITASIVNIRERFYLLVFQGVCNENQEIQKVTALCFSYLFFLLAFWDSDSSCVHWK